MDLLADGLPLSSYTGAAAQKAPGTHGEKLNCLASGQRLEGQTKVLTEATVPLSSLPRYLAFRLRQVPNLSLHQPGEHDLLHPGDTLRPQPTQLVGLPKPYPVVFPYK